MTDVIFISQEDFKEAFAQALDKYYEGAEQAGMSPQEIFVDGLLISAFTAVLQKCLFEKGEENSKLDVEEK